MTTGSRPAPSRRANAAECEPCGEPTSVAWEATFSARSARDTRHVGCSLPPGQRIGPAGPRNRSTSRDHRLRDNRGRSRGAGRHDRTRLRDNGGRCRDVGRPDRALRPRTAPGTPYDHQPIQRPSPSQLDSRPNRWTRRGIIPGSRIPASSCGRVQSRTATRPAGVTVARCCAPRYDSIDLRSLLATMTSPS